jgi:hypothetical protein
VRLDTNMLLLSLLVIRYYHATQLADHVPVLARTNVSPVKLKRFSQSKVLVCATQVTFLSQMEPVHLVTEIARPACTTRITSTVNALAARLDLLHRITYSTILQSFQ